MSTSFKGKLVENIYHMSKYRSIKVKSATWASVNDTILEMRRHGYYLKRYEVVDLALRKLMATIGKWEEKSSVHPSKP